MLKELRDSCITSGIQKYSLSMFSNLIFFRMIFLLSVRDMSEEDVENLNDLVAGSLTSPQDSRGPENSNSFATGTTQRWFPYEDCFKLDDERSLRSSEVLSMLSPFLGDERKQRIEEVVANRTYSICIAVEGLLDLGNVSAVCRSADALGFQSVHVISNETKKR